MSTQLFPQFETVTNTGEQSLPLYCDVAWDYERNAPRFSGGNPMQVTGLEAVKSWAYRAIGTARYQFSIFSWDYGCELETLIGQPYRADTKLAEATRYVTEALTVCPYITAVNVRSAAFDGSKLTMAIEMTTVYGKETLYV